jgi:uncharacterized protein (TIGR02118 family)
MARMVVTFRTPPNVAAFDKAAFDKHYFDVHVPLAKALPGLRKYVVSRVPIVSLNAAPPCHLVSTLYFDSLAAIEAAFATEQGQACAADRRRLAADADVQTFLFDDREV